MVKTESAKYEIQSVTQKTMQKSTLGIEVNQKYNRYTREKTKV